MATIDYQPYYIGQTAGYWTVPLLVGGSSPENLGSVSSSNITLYFGSGGVEFAGSGTITIKSSYPAFILYKPSPGDVALPFSGVVVVRAFYPPSFTSADEVCFDPLPFVIKKTS